MGGSGGSAPSYGAAAKDQTPKTEPATTTTRTIHRQAAAAAKKKVSFRSTAQTEDRT
ncbi:polysaccharide export protein [Anopheles sinensis]|uniref:Polysaccharide export protein n=1 Tax=Anopheles sinensis TaxID=74873 RepID=A0A084W8Q3_ANOSI|nr:polysaccharide export protein [Anopheles sinensis]